MLYDDYCIRVQTHEQYRNANNDDCKLLKHNELRHKKRLFSAKASVFRGLERRGAGARSGAWTGRKPVYNASMNRKPPKRPPSNQRLEIRMTPYLKGLLIAEGRKLSLSARAYAVRLLCKALNVSEDQGVVPNEPSGPKPNMTGIPKRFKGRST